MPEAYGGVIVDYCLGQTLNANQAEEQAKWNTEKKKKQGAGNIKRRKRHFFWFSINLSCTLNVKRVCAWVSVYSDLKKKEYLDPMHSYINWLFFRQLIYRTEWLMPNISQGEKFHIVNKTCYSAWMSRTVGALDDLVPCWEASGRKG